MVQVSEINTALSLLNGLKYLGNVYLKKHMHIELWISETLRLEARNQLKIEWL